MHADRLPAAHVRVVMPDPERSRETIHAVGLPCSVTDRDAELVAADDLLATDADLCQLCVAHHGLPSVVDLQALASAPATVLVFPQGASFHRDDGDGQPRCRADERGGGYREPREWPLDRDLQWREPCGRARCFGGEPRVGGAGTQRIATDGGQR